MKRIVDEFRYELAMWRGTLAASDIKCALATLAVIAAACLLIG